MRDWSDRPALILASGASAQALDLEAVRDKARVLAINESWRLAPWACGLYACDGEYWDRVKGAPGFSGFKVTQSARAAARWNLERVRLGEVDEILTDRPGVIGRGGHSGFQALNLVIQWGARRILLAGFDLKGDHWHGPHAPGLNNPRPASLAKWAKILDAQAGAIAALGVEVINLSPTSALEAFAKRDLSEVFCNA